jgi:hypothetical protein
MRNVVRSLPVLALLTLLSVVPAKAQPREPFSLQSRIPADSLVFLSLETGGATRANLANTAVWKLIHDPEMQAFLQPAKEALKKLVDQKMQEIPPLVIKLMQQLDNIEGQVAVALVGMDGERPDLVASIDFGDHTDAFVSFLEEMRKEVDPEGETLKTETKDGKTWWSVSEGGMPITATISDTAFVIGTSAERVASVVAGGAEGQPSLGTSPEFQGLRTQVGGDGLVAFAYGNVASAFSHFADDMPEEATKMVHGLGVDQIQAAGYGLAIQGDGFMDTLAIHAPGADRGILPLMRLPAMTRPTTLAYAPAGTFYWAEVRAPFDQILTRVRGLMKMVEPDATSQIEEGLAQADKHLGVDVEKDVLGGLSDTMGVYAALPETGGLYPEVAVILRPKEPAAYEAVFQRLTQGIASAANEGGDVICDTRTIDYHGKRLHLFELQAAHGSEPVPFTPTWAILGQDLVITLVPHAMKEIVLRQESGAAEGGLAAQEDFRTLLAQKPAGAGAMAYLDLQAGMSLLYDTAVPLLQTVAKPNVIKVPVDWALLPAARTIRPYLRSLAEFVTADENGIVLSYHAPVPMMPMVAVAMAAGFLGVRKATHMRGSARALREMPGIRGQPSKPGGPMGGLKQQMDVQLARVQASMLVEEVEFFRAEHNRLPETLDELVSSGVVDSIPNDPWGGKYRLRAGDDEGTSVVESAGPDRVFGTDDDVVGKKE